MSHCHNRLPQELLLRILSGDQSLDWSPGMEWQAVRAAPAIDPFSCHPTLPADIVLLFLFHFCRRTPAVLSVSGFSFIGTDSVDWVRFCCQRNGHTVVCCIYAGKCGYLAGFLFCFFKVIFSLEPGESDAITYGMIKGLLIKNVCENVPHIS